MSPDSTQCVYHHILYIYNMYHDCYLDIYMYTHLRYLDEMTFLDGQSVVVVDHVCVYTYIYIYIHIYIYIYLYIYIHIYIYLWLFNDTYAHSFVIFNIILRLEKWMCDSCQLASVQRPFSLALHSSPSSISAAPAILWPQTWVASTSSQHFPSVSLFFTPQQILFLAMSLMLGSPEVAGDGTIFTSWFITYAVVNRIHPIWKLHDGPRLDDQILYVYMHMYIWLPIHCIYILVYIYIYKYICTI